MPRPEPEDDQEPDYDPFDDDDPPMWICGCGEIVESAFHCERCGNEPPWGCDCGMHDAEDDLDPFDPEDDLDDLP